MSALSGAWAVFLVLFSMVLWRLLRRWGWGEAAGWLALTVAGQAAALQLLAVGNRVRLQHFHGWPDLLSSRRMIFLAIVVLHGILVGFGVWRNVRRGGLLRLFFSGLLSRRQMAGLLLILTFACTVIPPAAARALLTEGDLGLSLSHLTRIGLALFLLMAGTGSLALAAVTLPDPVRQELSAGWQTRTTRWLPWLAAGWVAVVASLLAWYPLAGIPHVPDELSYIFQAKYLATGALFLPATPDPQAFPCPYTLVLDDRWFAAMLSGWGFVLAIGYWLGVPWLVNPILAGAAVLIIHQLVRRLYSRNIADGTVVLLALSPWLLFMSANFLPHTTSLLLLSLGLLGIYRARDDGSLLWAAIAGLAFGAMLHVRALEAAVAVVGAMGVWFAHGRKKIRLAALAAAALPGLFMVLLLLAYNRTLLGNPFEAPVNRYFDLTVRPGANRIGFGKDIGFGWDGLHVLPGHGLVDVVFNSNQNLYMLHFEQFGWAGGSLLLVLLLFLLGKWRRDACMWVVLFAQWAAMSLYWFSGGPDYGARYWYLMILPCAVLTIRGALELDTLAKARLGRGLAGSRIWFFIAAATLIGTVQVTVWRALDKYPNYRGMRPDMRALSREQNFGRSLVFVQGSALPGYSSAFYLNPPRYDREFARTYSGPIYAFDRGPESRELLRNYYKDRPLWIVRTWPIVKNRLVVVAGPVAPGEPVPSSAEALQSKEVDDLEERRF